MRRKPVRKLLERIAERRTNLRSSRAHLVRRLAARPAAPPGAAGAYGLVLDHLDAELAAVETGVTAAEDGYVQARERVTASRRERNCAADDLRELYIPIQHVVGRLPVRGAPVLAFNPDSPAALAHHMPLAIQVLRDLAREPPPKVIGVTIDAGVLAGELEAGLAPLEAGLRALIEAESDLQVARARADEAFGPAQPVVKWVSQALGGLRGLADS